MLEQGLHAQTSAIATYLDKSGPCDDLQLPE